MCEYDWCKWPRRVVQGAERTRLLGYRVRARVCAGGEVRRPMKSADVGRGEGKAVPPPGRPLEGPLPKPDAADFVGS